MHPERVGNKSGALDTIPLVVDIVLFIPGLIPGLVAVIVDFGTGAIYLNGGPPTQLGDAGTFRAVPLDGPGNHARIELVDENGVVIAETTVDVDAVRSGQAIALSPTTPDAQFAALQQ